MRVLVAGFVAVALCFSSIGCCSSAREAAYHDGVKQYTVESGMLTEYEAYVDADPKLKPETKTIRKNTTKGLRALIAQEDKALKD